MQTKTCTKCKQTFPATREYFHSRKGKLDTRCKECVNLMYRISPDKHKKRVALNLEEIWALVRATCHVHRVEREMKEAKERQKAWREAR